VATTIAASIVAKAREVWSKNASASSGEPLVQLADRMQVSQPVIAALESGRGNPTVGQLAAVAEALQVGLDVDFPLLPGTPRAGVVIAP